jgi:hypothetical protein
LSPASSAAFSPDKYFVDSLPQCPAFFFVSKEDWKALRKTQVKRQFSSLDWTAVMSKGIKEVNPYCSFAFKRHAVKTVGSRRRGALFKASAYCAFEDCPVQVELTIDDDSLRANLTFSGEFVRHSRRQLVRRPVRASEREVLAEALQNKLPRSLFLEKLQGLGEDIYESGCRDGVPTAGVLKTLSSEKRGHNRLHEDDMLGLKMMAEEERGTESALIQQISQKPKAVMLWSAKTINVYFDQCKNDIVYIDATGSVVHRSMGDPKPYYIYEIVVRHPHKGSSPLPVATFVTTDQTTASVSHFIAAFLTDAVRQHGQAVRRRPVMVMCDGSSVLLQSLSMNFCGISLPELLKRYSIILYVLYSSPEAIFSIHTAIKTDSQNKYIYIYIYIYVI